jgi:hypothetical protein
MPKDLPVPAIQVDDSGKWPRIRSNVRGRRSQVVQAANRTGQPWLDNNVAQVRILQAAGRRPVLTYPWKPDTLADPQAGPSADDFATAVAEAGAFGADLLLDLDAALLPAWAWARRYLDYYARRDVRAAPMANVGVVTRDPAAWYEVLNLMARHNVPYRIVDSVDPLRAAGLDLVILTEPGTDAGELPAERVLRAGNDAADPNGFALKVWNRLGRKRRLVDVWNGITVLVGLERGAGERALRLEIVNYSAQPLPVQVRVRGIYGRIESVTPERPRQSLPFEHLDGYTEFVVPELRIGGTVVLRPE